MTIKEASKILNIYPVALRNAIEQNKVDFGICIMNKKRRTFYVNQKKFEEYLKK